MNNSTNTGNYAWNTQQNESKYHDSFNYQNYEDTWPSLAVFSPELGTEAPQQAREPCETVFVKLSCKWVKIPFSFALNPILMVVEVTQCLHNTGLNYGRKWLVANC